MEYTKEDLIAAAKYGYEYRDTTSFPNLSFEDNCENNVKQWIVGVLNNRVSNRPILKLELSILKKTLNSRYGHVEPSLESQIEIRDRINEITNELNY